MKPLIQFAFGLTLLLTTAATLNAAQTGSARNVGVIGVAFFAEAGDSFEPYSARELYLRDTAIPFPASDPRYAKPPR